MRTAYTGGKFEICWDHFSRARWRKAYACHLRWRIVYQRLARGLPYVEIAKNLSVSTSTVYRVFRLFEATGAVDPIKPSTNWEKVGRGPRWSLLKKLNCSVVNCLPCFSLCWEMRSSTDTLGTQFTSRFSWWRLWLSTLRRCTFPWVLITWVAGSKTPYSHLLFLRDLYISSRSRSRVSHCLPLGHGQARYSQGSPLRISDGQRVPASTQLWIQIDVYSSTCP